MAGIGSVEADNIEVAVFYPDSSGKQPLRPFFFWLDIDHDAACFAKELAPHKSETVIILLKVWVEHHHLREALRQESVRECGGERIQKVMHESLVLLLEHGIPGTTIQVNPPQEILVIDRFDVVIAVLTKILDIGFGQRVH